MLQSPTITGVAAVWVLVCTFTNARQSRLPNALMLVGLGASAALRIWQWGASGVSFHEPLIILVAWGLAWSFWSAGWWGGGDAKFLMVVMLAFPTLRLLLFLALANWIGSIVSRTFIHGRVLSAWRKTIPERGITSGAPDVMPAVVYLGAGWFLWLAAEVLR